MDKQAKDIVYLDVGGKIFKTTRKTLSLSKYFEAAMKNTQNLFTKDDPYFIDKDSEIFRHVLNLLRDPGYHYPEDMMNELLFYGIDYKAEESDDYEDKLKTIMSKYGKFKKETNNNILKEIYNNLEENFDFYCQGSGKNYVEINVDHYPSDQVRSVISKMREWDSGLEIYSKIDLFDHILRIRIG